MSEAGDTGHHDERRRGSDLTVDGTKVSFGGNSADRGDLLASYTAVLRAVRDARPGGEISLRTADLEVLATAVGADGHDVEARIRSLLGCTTAEAKRVHRELVRRRLLRPVAMLAVGSAIVWGPAAAASGDRPTLGEFQERPTEALVPAPALPGIPIEATTTMPTTTATPQPDAPTLDTGAITAPPISDGEATTLPGEPVAVEAAPTVPASEPSPPPTTTAPPTVQDSPSPTVAQPDVGIPGGETPTVIIAT